MDKDMNRNLKDTEKDFIKDTSSVPVSLVSSRRDRSLFYNKADKLITALYMVTDIIEKEEPVRYRLRVLGVEIISDMHSATAEVGNKITEVVSLLNIASAMNFISEMNCAILRKEFLELNGSMNENKETKPVWLSEFLTTPDTIKDRAGINKGHVYYKGHTRIGVQKGGTLMQALSDKTRLLSGNGTLTPVIKSGSRYNFDLLRSNRRNEIIAIIKNNGGSATIKDIKVKINGESSGSLACSEKTLQRELMSMTKEGILDKTGEKRWSKYLLKNR